jgi:hypothetical protein
VYRNLPGTLFMKHYDRGDLPIAVDFSGAKRKVIYDIYITVKRLHGKFKNWSF